MTFTLERKCTLSLCQIQGNQNDDKWWQWWIVDFHLNHQLGWDLNLNIVLSLTEDAKHRRDVKPTWDCNVGLNNMLMLTEHCCNACLLFGMKMYTVMT